MPGRILVIRGGALGDFILTLPSIRLLRENFPDCHLEILGYRHIAALAEGRFYAMASRSIEYGPLAGFFHPSAPLDAGLCDYFKSFGQVISYIYDPDGLFEGGLRRAGVKSLLTGSPIIGESEHAAYQLARPLAQLALWLDDPAAHIFPSGEDLASAEELLRGLPRPLVAIHPGSGSEKKNWPLEYWLTLQEALLSHPDVGHLLVVGGESDGRQLARLKKAAPERQTVLENIDLPRLGAVLSQCKWFLGHDSGISHLAAAAGVRCLLLFGPTNPHIWAPANRAVEVLEAPGGNLAALEPDDVIRKLGQFLAASHGDDHLR